MHTISNKTRRQVTLKATNLCLTPQKIRGFYDGDSLSGLAMAATVAERRT